MKKKKVLQHLITFILVVTLLLPMCSTVCAYAAEDLYLAYQTDESGNTVTSFKKTWEREKYKVTQLFLEPGDRADLCFINASFWKNAQWTSSNASVATVDKSGIITAVSPGVADITLTYTKKIWGNKVSATARVYVGEENWHIDIAPGKLWLNSDGYNVCNTYDIKVGGDIQFNIYGIDNLEDSYVYDIIWKNTNEDVVRLIDGTVKGLKEGTATITLEIRNKILGTTLNRNVIIKVTNSVYKNSAGWDNPYYLMYGENYKRLFSGNYLVSTKDVELDMLDDATAYLDNKLKGIGFSGFSELADIPNALKISFEGIFNGKDYMEEEGRRGAVLYLIQNLVANESLNMQYINNVEEALKKAQGIFSEIDKTKEFAEEIKKIEEAGLNVKKAEMDSILGYLLGEAAGDISNALSEGVTMTEYAVLALCFYEMDSKVLDDLQNCSRPGDNLYNDIELVRKEKEKDPVAFFKERYGNRTFAEVATKAILKLTGKKATDILGAVGDVVTLVRDIAGIPKLSEMTKASYLMAYASEVSIKVGSLRTEIKDNYSSYTEEELINKIEEYETVYSIYLGMIDPVINALQELEEYGHDKTLSEDAAIVGNGYDYNRHIATAMCRYMYVNSDADTYAQVKPVEIEIKENPGNTTEENLLAVQKKMDLLLAQLGVEEGKNTYFTVNQNACAESRISSHGCINCNVSDIVQTAWFKKIFGDVTVGYFPAHDVDANRRDYAGQSCFGFACFAQWYLYADNLQENIGGKRVAAVPFNKENMEKYAKPGDVIRVNGHSVLVYSLEKDGVMVIDNNWNMGGQLNCLVQKHLLSYTNTYYAGYTAYINRVIKTANMEEGQAGLYTGVTNVKLEEQTSETQSTTNTEKIYGTLDLSATGWSGYNVGTDKEMNADKAYTIRHGAKLEILGKYTNSKGNQVYHVYSYDLGRECYINAKYVKVQGDVIETEKYGYLELPADWKGYNVGTTVEMYADKAYTIYPGAKLKILGEYTNSKGNRIYQVYSFDLNMNCYVAAKYVIVK